MSHETLEELNISGSKIDVLKCGNFPSLRRLVADDCRSLKIKNIELLKYLTYFLFHLNGGDVLRNM
jgi:hypothetical protein